MIPERITAPATPVVDLQELQDHVNADPGVMDSQLVSYEKAAVAHLDGYRGVLGRCILEQEWAVSLPAAGTWRLPLPDIIKVVAEDADGNAVDAALCQDALGATVIVSEPATIRMTAAMPEEAVEAVRIAIKLLVGHWVANREAVAEAGLLSVPLSFEEMIGPLRWTRI